MPELKDLREKRARLLYEADELIKSITAEQMTVEEEGRFDALHAEAEKIASLVRRMEQQEDAMKEAEASRGRQTDPAKPGTDISRGERAAGTAGEVALRAWLLHPTDQRVPEEWHQAAVRSGIDPAKTNLVIKFPRRALRHRYEIEDWEKRAQSLVGSEGGFTVPEEFWRALEVSMLEFGGMRQAATVIRTDSGSDLPIPTTNDTSNKGVILAENTQVAEQDVAFGQVVLQAYKYSSKMIRVSVELLQDSAFNLAELLGRMLGERIGRITNDHFTTGTGSSQPNGLVTASGLGKTGATGQTATVIYDDLVDLQHSVDPAYRANARWMFHDLTLAAIKKLKDLDERPLWVPGLAVREPDRILGDPYIVNQSMPQLGTSAKSILYGAIDKYYIRDVREVTLVRLDERFADYHQVAFLAFSRHDGDLIDAGTDPVKHYANAAS
jgi:HK97 family phage major capsid protein